MSTCPNVNSKEWRDLTDAVGSFQAYKDYLETGTIRTPAQVQAKLDDPSYNYGGENPLVGKSSDEVSAERAGTLIGNALLWNPQNNLDLEKQDNTRAFEIATQLSEQLGIDFDIIDQVEAAELTKDAQNPWDGEKAFFIGGKVYFVGDSLSTDTAFHEFSHPVVRALSKDNSKLFNKLFDDIRQSADGTEIIASVEQNYPELALDSDLFKEEVIVQVLSKAGENTLENLKNPKGIRKILDNILYAIKQFLRKIFGQKINISKLDENTTIDQLAEMLATGGKFEIDTEMVSEEDIAAYVKDRTQEIEDLENIGDNELQALINSAYNKSSSWINTLNENKNFDELAELLVNEFKTGELDEAKKNIEAYQTLVGNTAERVSDDMEHMRQKVAGFINFTFRMENMMVKMDAHVKDLSKSMDSIDNMRKMHYYDGFVKHWEGFVSEALSSVNNKQFNIPHDSQIVSKLQHINTLIQRIKGAADNMYMDGVKDTLMDELMPMAAQVKDRYDKIISRLRDKGAPQSSIDKWYKQYYGLTEAEYAKMKTLDAKDYLNKAEESERVALKREHFSKGLELTPEKVTALIKGQAGDANFFNSYLEGYLYNADPIIGGLALHVKNKTTEVLAKVQSKHNEFMQDMKPLLKAAGYANPLKVSGLGEKITFKDRRGFETKDGTFEEKIVHTFLNAHKDWDHDRELLRYNKREAKKKWDQTGSDEDRQAFIDAVTAENEFESKYMNRQYTDEYYAVQNLLTQDDTGREAKYMRDNLFERMRMLTEPAITESDIAEIADQVDELWREYRQLYSLRNLSGELKTGKDREITERLREHRDLMRQFVEWEPKHNAFNNALLAYEQELKDKGIEGAEFDQFRQDWIDRNTRTVIKREFYDYRQDLFEQINQILSKLPDADRKKVDMGQTWEQLIDLAAVSRDQDGQPDGTQLSSNSINQVKRLQEELEQKKENYAGLSGITSAQSERLNVLQAFSKVRDLTEEEKKEMGDIYDQMSTKGLNEFDKARLFGLFAELSELSHKEATDYYTDVVNTYLEELDTNELNQELGTRVIDRQNADLLLQSDSLERLLDQDPKFKQWFMDNHIQKEVYNKEISANEFQWERLYVWNVTRPNDASMMETTEVMDEEGNVKENIQGLPVMRFYTRKVKPEYRNKKIVGSTVDNRGKWLPKTVEQGAFDNKYINEEYYRLMEEDPKLFAALEKMKEHHLGNQTGLNRHSKLYLDVPRFMKRDLEVYQTKGIGKKQMNLITHYAKRTKEFFKGAKDDPEEGYNYDDEFNLVRMDMFDNEETKVPIAGLYDLDHEDVSLNVTESMMRYMLSAERQKQLVEISPFARSLQRLINNPELGTRDFDEINKQGLVSRVVRVFKKDKDLNVRKKAVNAFIEREFEGQKMAGKTGDIPWVNKTANLLFKRASFSFFALNIPSALKNAFGAKFQGMIEASAGEHLNHLTFAKGEGWSFNTMRQISQQIYKRGPKSLNIQITELFDPAQGRYEEQFGENLSRTSLKDTANLSWLYSSRKWLELQATFQIFGGMMYHKKIERTVDGQTKKIPYMEAWEVRDGKIQLKEGVDPSWGVTYDTEGNQITGAEFKKFRNKMHQVQNNLQGAYSQFDQPEAQRYLAYRMTSYLRRYFTPMFVNRFGFKGRMWDPQPRLNPGLGDVHQGYYVTFLQTVAETVKKLGRNLPYMTPGEKRAAYKTTTEVAALSMLYPLMLLLFGWDPDDDEKYQKLREKSGHIPFLFAPEDKDHPFDPMGYLENHALFLMMNIRAENEQFLPFPGYGLDDLTALTDVKSIAFGPTTDTYSTLVEDMANIATGSDAAYYKREVGPYNWQQEGGNKFWAHVGVTIGFTGSSVDPVKAIKGFQSSVARGR